MRNYLQKLKPYIFLVAVWAILVVLSFAYSRDLFAYHCWFDNASALAPMARFFGLSGYFHDPAYYFLQAIGTMILPFEAFFILLILVALVIKLIALLRITKTPTLLDVLPYLMVLSFLHEGTQIRVALALSIALWSLIVFAEGKRVEAALILCLASAFHLSVASFFLVFILLFLYERVGVWTLIIIALASMLFAYSTTLRELILDLGKGSHGRFMVYLTGTKFKIQNTSSLFQYYSLFIGVLIFLVWRLHQPSNQVWGQLKKLALMSGYLALLILQVLRFNVVISSRIADLLLLPILLVLGAALSQAQRDKKINLAWFAIILLISYGCARGFITYRPIPKVSESLLKQYGSALGKDGSAPGKDSVDEYVNSFGLDCSRTKELKLFSW